MNDSEKKELNELLQRLIQIKSVNPPGNEDGSYHDWLEGKSGFASEPWRFCDPWW